MSACPSRHPEHDVRCFVDHVAVPRWRGHAAMHLSREGWTDVVSWGTDEPEPVEAATTTFAEHIASVVPRIEGLVHDRAYNDGRQAVLDAIRSWEFEPSPGPDVGYLRAQVAALPEDGATRSRDYGRGYAQAVRDVLDLIDADQVDSEDVIDLDEPSIADCTCVYSCADDPTTQCDLSGVVFHVHPPDPCPVHPEAPGDH